MVSVSRAYVKVDYVSNCNCQHKLSTLSIFVAKMFGWGKPGRSWNARSMVFRETFKQASRIQHIGSYGHTKHRQDSYSEQKQLDEPRVKQVIHCTKCRKETEALITARHGKQQDSTDCGQCCKDIMTNLRVHHHFVTVDLDNICLLSDKPQIALAVPARNALVATSVLATDGVKKPCDETVYEICSVCKQNKVIYHCLDGRDVLFCCGNHD